MEEKVFNKERFGEGLTLVDFWAPWCGPCKMQSRVMEKFEEIHPEIKVVKINVDEEGELSVRLGIMSIPTLMVLKDCEPMETAIGFHSMEELEALIARHA